MVKKDIGAANGPGNVPPELILYDTAEAARILRLSERTMAEWRACRGDGPGFTRYGKRSGHVLCSQQDLFDFVRANKIDSTTIKADKSATRRSAR